MKHMNIGPKHIHNIYLSLFPYKFLVDLPQTRVWEWQINLTYHFGHTWNISFIHSSEEHNIIIYTLFSGAYYIYTLLDLWSISFIQLFEPYYYLYTLLGAYHLYSYLKHIIYTLFFGAYHLYTFLKHINIGSKHLCHNKVSRNAIAISEWQINLTYQFLSKPKHIIYTLFWNILMLVPNTWFTIFYLYLFKSLEWQIYWMNIFCMVKPQTYYVCTLLRGISMLVSNL